MSSMRILSISLLVAPLVLGACAQSETDYRLSNQMLDAQATSEAAGVNHANGKVHFEAGRYGLAAEAFRKAVDGDPVSVASLNGLAASYDKIGRFDLAERYYRRALTIEPDSVQSLNNLGYSYLMQGRYDQAFAYLREAQLLDENNPVVESNWQSANAALQSVGGSRQAAVAEVEPVQAVEVTAQSKLWIERTSSDVQTLRFPGQDTAEVFAPLVPSRTTYQSLTTTSSLVSDPIDSIDQPRAAPVIPVQVAELDVAALAEPLSSIGFADTPRVAPIVPVQVTQLAALPIEEPEPLPDPQPVPQLAAVPTRGEQIESPAIAVVELEPIDLPMQTSLALRPELDSAVIEVSNGTGRLDMAKRMQGFLQDEGVPVRWLSNANHYSHLLTTVFYKAEFVSQAESLASLLPAHVKLEARDEQRADIEVELGGDLLDFDAELYYAGGQLKPSS